MRRMLILALAVLSLVAVLPADVFAQAAPTPQVTISGFIQQVTSYRHNYSATDLNFGRTNDTEWYARTRGRFDLTGQVGQVIGRLGLEVDAMWGQSGINDCQGTHSGTNCAFDQNTDMSAGSSISGTSVSTAGSIELRHLWTQFPVTGKDSLMPFIPVDTVGRFGGQPYAFTYKGAVLATGDFGGVDLVTTITPNIRTQVIYTQIEEQVETLARSNAVTGFGTRGDDHAILFGVDITPIKGLDIKPMYAYLFIDGLTGQARLAKGGFSAGGGGPFSPGGSLGRAAGLVETRHTLGFDARWRMGPISIEPTLLYQFGSRESVITAGRLTAEGAVGTRRDADISAWLLDVRGGYRVGPLLVEGLFFWTSGNRARDQLTQNVNYYQPISTDTTYLATWAEILALNIDFNQGLTSLGTHIGYDRYGRIGIGARVFYDLTPALTFNFKWNTQWTDKSVDTDGFLTAGAGLTPSIVDRVSLRSARPEGDSRYLGTELDLGFTWRFAPGVTFDAVYGYLITGPAFGVRAVASDYNAGAGLPLNKDRNVNGVQIFSARVNYNF